MRGKLAMLLWVQQALLALLLPTLLAQGEGKQTSGGSRTWLTIC